MEYSILNSEFTKYNPEQLMPQILTIRSKRPEDEYPSPRQ